MPDTPLGIPYPASTGHVRLWEHFQPLAEEVDALIAALQVATTGLLKATYTPDLSAVTTPPNMGSGGNFAKEGWYFKIGRMVVGGYYLRFGTAGVSAGAGSYLVSLPVAADIGNPLRASTAQGVNQALGVCQLRDNSAPTILVGATSLHDANNLRMRDSGSVSAEVNAASPWTWAAEDVLSGTFAYAAAS